MTTDANPLLSTGVCAEYVADLTRQRDELADILARLVGGLGHEGDLFDCEAHAAARAVLAKQDASLPRHE